LAINRYYYPDPAVTGPIEFFAGWGQRRQQVDDVEAQWQQQVNQQTGQGIGQGIGNFFNTIAGDMTAGRASNRQLQNALTVQRGAQAGEMAQQQLRYSVPNDYYQVMQEWYGAGDQGSPAPQRGGGVPGEYGVSLPEQQVSQTFPQAAPQPLSGEALRAGQQARQQLANLEEAVNKEILHAGTPMQKLAVARAALPVRNRLREMASRNQPPPPPTIQELAQSGKIPGYDNTVFVDGKGTPHNFTLHPEAGKGRPWEAIPDLAQAEQMKERSARMAFGGNYDAFLAKGGYGEVDEKGKWNFTLPAGGGETEELSYVDYAKLMAYDELDKEGEKTGKKIVPTPREWAIAQQQIKGMGAALGREREAQVQVYEDVDKLARTMRTTSVPPAQIKQVVDRAYATHRGYPPEELLTELNAMMIQTQQAWGGGAPSVSGPDYSDTSSGAEIAVLERGVAAKREKEAIEQAARNKERERKRKEKEAKRRAEQLDRELNPLKYIGRAGGAATH